VHAVILVLLSALFGMKIHLALLAGGVKIAFNKAKVGIGFFFTDPNFLLLYTIQ